MLFIRFIVLISLVVVYYSHFYICFDVNRVRFLMLTNLFVGSMVLLVFSPSLLGIIIGWDGLGVTSFLLVIYYNNISSLRSGLLTIYINRIGDIFFIFCFFFIVFNGWFIVDVFFVYFLGLFSTLMLIAGITRRAQMPFSSWLPAAISAPTPISSLVHSSTLVTAGVYLFIRFVYFLEGAHIVVLFYSIRLLTFFLASLMACVENDLKKLVAISTLRQLGVLMFSFSIGNIYLTFFHIVSHALFKSLLFLSCGFIIFIRFSSQDMRFMGGKFIVGKSIMLMFFLSIFSLCGFPFLRGFFSKDLILELAFNVELGFLIILFFFISCLFSVFYGIKLMYESLIGTKIGFFITYGSLWGGTQVIIGVLFVWSVVFGKCFFLLLLDSELYIFICWQKVFGGLVVLVSFFLIFLGWKFKLSKTREAITWEMFILRWFFGGFFSSKSVLTDFLLVGESFWLEVVGVKGFLSRVFLVATSFLMKFSSYSISVFLMVFMFLFIFLLLFSL